MYIMDVVFGEVSNVDGDVSIPVISGDGRKVFKQFNNVRVEDVDQEQIVFNLQENDLSSYDEDILAAAKVHKKEWFGREVKDSVIDKSYQSPVKDGLFTTSTLRTAGGECGVRCFNHQKEPIEFSDLSEGTVCSVVVELKRICLYKKTWEPEWYSVQIRAAPAPDPDPYDGYLFQDDE
jgi:hypothetical protein